MITRLDTFVGNILNLLDELKLADDTIVIFSSNNGTTHLDLEVDYTFFKSVGELRGLKGSLYEGGSSDYVSGFEDWMPTILDMVGSKSAIPKNIDGISIAKNLAGEKQTPRDFLYREFTGYGGQQTIRVADWKAVRQNIGKGNLEIELYNMKDDISETSNVAADNPKMVEKLKAMMDREHTPSKDFPLKALGDPVTPKKRKKAAARQSLNVIR